MEEADLLGRCEKAVIHIPLKKKSPPAALRARRPSLLADGNVLSTKTSQIKVGEAYYNLIIGGNHFRAQGGKGENFFLCGEN